MQLLKPPRLRRGEVIGVVAPSSPPLDLQRVQHGIRYLERLGYQVQTGRHIASQHGFYAGTDRERAADLNAMFRDPRIQAIFALRGGHGSARLLPFLDYPAVRRSPKILVGFSDITALQLGLLRRTGLVSFSGPLVAVEFGQAPDPRTEEQFWRMITSTRRPGALAPLGRKPWTTWRHGRAEGPLIAGNLALLTSLIGSRYLPKFDRAILVVEDVGEHLHRVDRMLLQLQHAGILKRIGGLLFGQFNHCHPQKPGAPHLSLSEVLKQAADACPVPTAHGAPYGHIPRRWTLPMGVRARLDTRRSHLTLLEAAVTD
jgi:muramoyltetrapeptide carboxypeptidase